MHKVSAAVCIYNQQYFCKSMKSDVRINNSTIKTYRKERDPGKPAIIFLHDSLGCIKLWRNFPDMLGELTGCSVLVYDRQGYGESGPFTQRQRTNNYMELEADLLNSLLAEWGITEAILFGHSDGGTIALIAAAKYPGAVKGVITEGAHIFVEDITIKGIEQAVSAYHTTDLKSRLQKYHGDKTDDVFHAWADTWLSKAYRTWDITGMMPLIACPVLIIQGEDDEYGTLKQVTEITGHVKGKASSLIIPSVGHTPHREATDVVLASAASFIRECLNRDLGD